MKKVFSILVLLVSACLLFAGCGNEYAEKEYNDLEKIADSADRYSKSVSTFSQLNNVFTLKSEKFDGRETLWRETVSSEKEIEIEVNLSVSKGAAKLVYIDNDNNVSTIIECSSETSKQQSITEKLTLKKGLNRLKIVGKGCNDLNLRFEIK